MIRDCIKFRLCDERGFAVFYTIYFINGKLIQKFLRKLKGSIELNRNERVRIDVSMNQSDTYLRDVYILWNLASFSERVYFSNSFLSEQRIANWKEGLDSRMNRR